MNEDEQRIKEDAQHALAFVLWLLLLFLIFAHVEGWL